MRTFIIVLVAAAIVAGSFLAFNLRKGDWRGADDSVEEIATANGRPPAAPLIDIDHHPDVGLFVFLMAGVVGGFVAGYVCRGFFDPRLRGRQHGSPPTPSSVNPAAFPRSDSHA